MKQVKEEIDLEALESLIRGLEDLKAGRIKPRVLPKSADLGRIRSWEREIRQQSAYISMLQGNIHDEQRNCDHIADDNDWSTRGVGTCYKCYKCHAPLDNRYKRKDEKF